MVLYFACSGNWWLCASGRWTATPTIPGGAFVFLDVFTGLAMKRLVAYIVKFVKAFSCLLLAKCTKILQPSSAFSAWYVIEVKLLDDARLEHTLHINAESPFKVVCYFICSSSSVILIGFTAKMQSGVSQRWWMVLWGHLFSIVAMLQVLCLND